MLNIYLLNVQWPLIIWDKTIKKMDMVLSVLEELGDWWE